MHPLLKAKNKKSLEYIKIKLPDYYICDSDGKIIFRNL